MSIFDDMKTGLSEAIEYEKGTLKAKATTITIAPVLTFAPVEIKSIKDAERCDRNRPAS